MKRLVICLGLLMACGASVASAAESRTEARPDSAANAPRGARAPGAAKAPGRADLTWRAAPRTLEDIHIEGEIPVPQVLFVTVRDQRRYTQFHHRRYLKTSRQIGEETVLPSRLALSRAQGSEPR